MSFRTRLLASVAAAVMMSGTAFAADLPSRTMAPAAPYLSPAPVFTWTGFYIGANAGVAFGNGNGGSVTPFGFTAPAPGTAYVPSGNGTQFTGGGQVGYNWQAGSFVYGLEADFDYVGNGNHGVTVPAGPTYPLFVAVNRNQGDFLGTVRGRLGYAVDRALFYVTGGLAYGAGGGTNGLVTYYPTPGVAYAYTNSGSNANVGYAVGGGIEYAFTQNWSGRIEYLYVNRGSWRTTYFAPAGAPAGSSFSVRNNNDNNIIRVGLNYKF